MDMLDRDEIARAIQARHLCTSLSVAEIVRPLDRVADVDARLRALQFDAAPVLEASEPVGIFHAGRAGEGQVVRDVMQPLSAAMMVSADTAVGELAQELCREPFLFVLKGSRVIGFLTPADLGSAPARTHNYLLLAAVEILLASLLRDVHPDQSTALELLGPGARKRHARTVADLRLKDEFLDDVAALSLADLILLAGKYPEFREEACRGGRGWNWLQDGIVSFRDDVMHPARDFTRATGSRIQKLADFDSRLKTLARAAEACMARRRQTEANASPASH